MGNGAAQDGCTSYRCLEPCSAGDVMATKKAEVLSQRQTIRLRNQDPEVSRESPDPTPIHIPGLTDNSPPLSLREEMRRFISQEVSKVATDHGEESFEESNDLDITEDVSDILSPYTHVQTLLPEHPAFQDLDDLEGQPTQEDLEATQASSLDNQGRQPQESPLGDSGGPGGAETAAPSPASEPQVQ
ncbi:hypothetical protein [Microviridae sp.]|nr:hypothetical protein [Microviridae sp.]